jgi:hypothetical protein
MALAAPAKAAEFTNSVLNLGVGARPLGMGGAYVGLADDSTSTYWNPAGLADVQSYEVSAAGQAQESAALALDSQDIGSDYLFLSGGMAVPGIGAFGVSALHFGVSGIPQSSGVPVPGQAPPVPNVGTFSTADWALFAGYGVSVIPAVDLGVTLKDVFGGVSGLGAGANDGISGGASYETFGADLGLKVKFGELSPALQGLNLGLNLQNLVDSGVRWQNTPGDPVESVAMNPKAGLAYALPFGFLEDAGVLVNLAVDVDPSAYAPSTLIRYGAEAWYNGMLALRGGLMEFTDSRQGAEPSVGAGLRYLVLQVDYAYLYYESTPIQYLDLTVRW